MLGRAAARIGAAWGNKAPPLRANSSLSQHNDMFCNQKKNTVEIAIIIS